jgi:hypothetical protein
VTDGSSSRFSLVGIAVAVVTVGLGAAAGLAIVPVVGSYLGMLLGGFVAGLAIEERPLLESGVAAVLASLGILAAGGLVGNGIVDALGALVSVGPLALLTSVVLGFAVGAFGAHFGDDLREGLTTPVEAPPSGSTTPEPTPAPPTDEERSAREVAEETSTAEDTEDPPEGSATGDGSASDDRERAGSEELELERE